MSKQSDNVRFDYDATTDVLQVTFGTGEPSFGEEVDDLLIVEYGIYSGTPTGFQLLHVREVGVDKVELRLKRLLPKLRRQESKQRSALRTGRNRLLQQAIKALERKAEDLVAA